MNEEELIELIQSRLPQELTAGEIAELRAMMKTSPRLREALLEELSLEQGLATRYAPAAQKVEEIVSRIAERTSARRRTRWLLIHLGFAFCLAAVIAGVLLLAHVLGEPEAEPPELAGGGPKPAARPAATAPAATQEAPATPDHGATPRVGVATGQPSSAPGRPTPSATPDPNAADRPEPAAATHATARTDVPPAGANWRLFDPPPATEQLSLRRRFDKLFKPVSGSRLQTERYYLGVRGKYRLRDELAEGNLLRLTVLESRSFALDAWHGQTGARLAADNDGTVRGYLLARKGRDTVATAAGMDRRWGQFRRGTLDVRFQDGRIVAARGDIVLLSLPIAGRPGEVQLDADCKLTQVRMMPCAPIALPAPTGTVVLDSDRPSGLTWSAERLHGATLRKHGDGSVELSAAKPKEDALTWTDLAAAPGKDICFQLRDITDDTGVDLWFQDKRRHVRHYFAEYRGVKVITEDRSGSGLDRAFKRGRVLLDALWLRVRLGLDYAEIDISRDGEHWAELYRFQLEKGHQAGPKVQFGLLVRREHTGRIRVARVRIRRFGKLTALADAGLIRRVPDSPKIRAAETIETVWPELVAAKPPDAEAWQWRLACATALVGRSERTVLRRAAARDLLETAERHVPDVGAVLAGLEEFAGLCYPDDRSADEQWLVARYEALGHRCFTTGRRDRLVDVLDSWCHRTMAAGRRRWEGRLILPVGLVRLALYDLLDRQQWPLLMYHGGRMLSLMRSSRGELPTDPRYGGGVARLAQWMRAYARPAVVDRPDTDLPDVWDGSWTHPLTVEMDRESLNVISEFVASVNAKAYSHAAKVLASETLPDGITSTDADGQLYQSIHFRIRRLIQEHGELARTLRERFAPLGAIRLRRALAVGDAEVLRSLAVQFHGTQPGRAALYHLADRDLSMGNVLGAAAKYGVLLDEADAAAPPDLAAKFRLASALGGQLAGQPVTGDVSLPGRRFSAGDFEKMVASLARSRRTGGREIVVTAHAAPAPAPRKVGLAGLIDLAADKEDRNRPFTHQVAWAPAGRSLIVHQRGRVWSVHLDSRKTAWSKHESLRHSSYTRPVPAWPIVAGNRIFLRIDSRRDTHLACFDLKKGEMLWRQRFDEGVLSDPILINGWLYVLTRRTTVGDLAEIHLRRVSPETGECPLSARLVRLRRDQYLLQPGRLVLAGDLLLFRCSASLVCCNLLGEVQWIRRLTYVPPDVDRRLLQDLLPGEIIVRGRHVIFASAASPHLECIDVRTGRRTWSYLQPELRKPIGLLAGNVVLATDEHLEAVDANSGKLVWRAACTADPDAILPAGKDSILCVTLDRVDPHKKGKYGREVREARWLSAADGRTLRTEALADPKYLQTIYDATRLYATGREVVGLASYDSKRRSAKVFVLRPR